MTRISDAALDVSFYLYRSATEARAGGAEGGTGFFVMIPSSVKPGMGYIYAVTAAHVIAHGGTVIRINAVKPMDVVCLETQESEWIRHGDGDDLAVIPISGATEFSLRKMKWVTSEIFVTRELVAKWGIGIGDETFMIGRFRSHPGIKQNLPAARFGCISMMPSEPVQHPASGILQESYLVEMRSLSGFSGSPVFCIIPSGSKRPGDAGQVMRGELGPWLLGIDWVHFSIDEAVREPDGSLVDEKLKIRDSTGMMGVIPAWRLLELLNDPRVAPPREAAEGALRDNVVG